MNSLGLGGLAEQFRLQFIMNRLSIIISRYVGVTVLILLLIYKEIEYTMRIVGYKNSFIL